MEYRNLGRSGLKVPPLCLGTMTFGEADANSFMHKVGCDEATAFTIMSRALDKGVDFFDTADVYGQDGLTEKVVGAWLHQNKTRDRITLATKFRFRTSPGANGTGASRLRIVRCVEDSLRRLQTDRIDLYQIHMQDLDTPEEETLRALDDLVRAGKVLYLGCSNYTAWRLMDSAHIAGDRGLTPFVSLQAQWSLIERGLERELVPACRRLGMGILPWSPLARGLLTGKYRRDQRPTDGSRLTLWKDSLARDDNERTWRVIDAVVTLAEVLSTTPSAVAMAWLLAKPEVSSVIFGARSLAQLDDNLRAVEVKLTAEQVSALDEAASFELGYPYDFIRRIQGRW